MRANILGLSLLLTACSLAPFEPTVGSPDAGAGIDAGRVGVDAGGADGGRVDAGAEDGGGVDGGTPPTDAGSELTDAGFDAGRIDACVAATETCNGRDDDCNGRIDDGLSMTCMNACGTVGSIDCVGGTFSACDAPTVPPEACNGIDDDCNGVIDDGAGCPCRLEHFGTHAYLFCTSDVEWVSARDACRAVGYALVTIDDGMENDFVETTALGLRGGRDWWIGLNDREMEGTYVWVAGDVPATYTQWGTGEPSGGSDDCVRMFNGDRPLETPGRWGDWRCIENNPYVCEAP